MSSRPCSIFPRKRASIPFRCAKGFDPFSLRTGIIGHGNVGSRVRQKLDTLGIETLLNDPPKQRLGRDTFNYVSLQTLIDECDFITCHVPLTLEGRDPTHHLLNRQRLAELRPGCILFNAARGSVSASRIECCPVGILVTQAMMSQVIENKGGVPDRKNAVNISLQAPRRLPCLRCFPIRNSPRPSPMTSLSPVDAFTLRFDGWILGTEERTHARACITRRPRPAPSNNQNKSVET